MHKNEGEVATAGDGEMLSSEHGPNEEQYETVKEKVYFGGEGRGREGGREGQKNQLRTDYVGTLQPESRSRDIPGQKCSLAPWVGQMAIVSPKAKWTQDITLTMMPL